MDKRYRVSYWGESEYEPTDSELKKRDVIMPDETKMILVTGRTVPFLRFIIDDGQEWFVPSDHVVEIVEVW
jgi:hypothetical protein